ncbi:uncharacterized protein LOC116304334, partial [Actinia tenebrosa]|uniref:Uncharacterized protein LOC116304334 n=1 Tax=Actinia tenebrosa TaxID=6105 RepID=A0A6P8ISG2_ACTTE
VQEKAYKGLMCMQKQLGNSQQLEFTLFLLHGTNQEIETQISAINQFVKSKIPPGILVNFLEPSSDDDNYTFPVPLCGQGYVKCDVNVNGNTCCVRFYHDEVFVSIPDIKEKSGRCIDGAPAHETRLHDPDLPACIRFSLFCKTPMEMRTPTNFKVVLTTTDENRTEIFGNHKAEKYFSACFYGTDEMSQKNPNAGNSLMPLNDWKILVDNHDNICDIQDWDAIIKWFVTDGALDKKFLNESLSKERKGEIMRHLYQVENIFHKFIDALQTTGGNGELINLLLQCMASMENQNSSL